MEKSLTCKKVSAGVKPYKQGKTTTRKSATIATEHDSDFVTARGMTLVQAAAAGAEKSARFPLQEQDDRHQHNDFAGDRRAGGLLEDLIHCADPEGGTNRADDAPDAA